MSGRVVPVDSKRADWSRITATEVNRLRKDVTAQQAQTQAKLRFLYGG